MTRIANNSMAHCCIVVSILWLSPSSILIKMKKMCASSTLLATVIVLYSDVQLFASCIMILKSENLTIITRKFHLLDVIGTTDFLGKTPKIFEITFGFLHLLAPIRRCRKMSKFNEPRPLVEVKPHLSYHSNLLSRVFFTLVVASNLPSPHVMPAF
jgi:hypothetical protein